MITRLLRIIRGLLEDNLETTTQTETYTTIKTFPALKDNAVELLSTKIDGSALVSGQSATLDTSSNDFSIVATLTSGQLIQFKYTYYSNFSDSQIKAAVEAALSYISISGIKDFYYNTSDYSITPYPNKKEESLIAIIASIILKPLYTQYQTSTINLRFPETMSKQEKINNVLSQYKFSPTMIFGIGKTNTETE